MKISLPVQNSCNLGGELLTCAFWYLFKFLLNVGENIKSDLLLNSREEGTTPNYI